MIGVAHTSARFDEDHAPQLRSQYSQPIYLKVHRNLERVVDVLDHKTYSFRGKT